MDLYDEREQTTGMHGYPGEASWHVFAKCFKMLVIVTHDRKCPVQLCWLEEHCTSWLARFSRLSGFDRETCDRLGKFGLLRPVGVWR
jgi:hypothetical protein